MRQHLHRRRIGTPPLGPLSDEIIDPTFEGRGATLEEALRIAAAQLDPRLPIDAV
jgi:hypothetical protein